MLLENQLVVGNPLLSHCAEQRGLLADLIVFQAGKEKETLCGNFFNDFPIFFFLVSCLQSLTVFLKGLITHWSSLCVFHILNCWMWCVPWIERWVTWHFFFHPFSPILFYLSGSWCERSPLLLRWVLGQRAARDPDFPALRCFFKGV